MLKKKYRGSKRGANCNPSSNFLYTLRTLVSLKGCCEGTEMMFIKCIVGLSLTKTKQNKTKNQKMHCRFAGFSLT
jgi:hypothetical protein